MDIPLSRAVYAAELSQVMETIGSPVERELAYCKLPIEIKEFPNEYLFAPRVTQFAARCSNLEGAADLGWLCAKRFSGSRLSEKVQTSLRLEVTLERRLQKLFALARLETSLLSYSCAQIKDTVYVTSDMRLPEVTGGYPITEWYMIAVLIAVIRDLAGETWQPKEIAFTSETAVSDGAQMAFPNTRFRTGAPATSISFPVAVLSITSPYEMPTSGVDTEISNFGEVESIHKMMRPYLLNGPLSFNQFSAIIGVEPRKLQRNLEKIGTNYSQTAESVRFEIAVEMLADPDIKIIDVAQTLGYENQANFGRSFLRFMGISPGAYRRIIQTDVNQRTAAS